MRRAVVTTVAPAAAPACFFIAPSPPMSPAPGRSTQPEANMKNICEEVLRWLTQLKQSDTSMPDCHENVNPSAMALEQNNVMLCCMSCHEMMCCMFAFIQPAQPQNVSTTQSANASWRPPRPHRCWPLQPSQPHRPLQPHRWRPAQPHWPLQPHHRRPA